jgi:hypothetical protein
VKVRGVLKGDWRFTAQMTCDQLQRPVTEQESTQVYGDANEGLSSPAPVPAPAPLPGQPDK